MSSSMRALEYQSGDRLGPAPTPGGKHILVVMDQHTRIPEVKVVNSISINFNMHALKNIFSGHAPPNVFLKDGEPPWDTNPSHPSRSTSPRWASNTKPLGTPKIQRPTASAKRL